MSSQKFYANPKDSFEYPNGAIGYRSGGPFDCLGPFAKVTNCPVDGVEGRYTCYATGLADTYYSVPACTRIKGAHIRGFFMLRDEAIEFVPERGQLDKIKGRGLR